MVYWLYLFLSGGQENNKKLCIHMKKENGLVKLSLEEWYILHDTLEIFDKYIWYLLLLVHS
jgi:hypothetical protein